LSIGGDELKNELLRLRWARLETEPVPGYVGLGQANVALAVDRWDTNSIKVMIC
jgi:hypothetical protein